MKRTVVLVVLDGWGIGKNDNTNPIHEANPENINYIKANYPSGALQASGISVGLPWGEEGNSEVGHLTIGAGKILYQDYPRITLAIKDKSFFKNEVFKKAFARAKENNSSVNLVGLLGSGNVHSSLEHIKALLAFAEQEGVSDKVNLHLITDGRDSPPESAASILKEMPREKIKSVSGRFYAMDRDNHWERTQKTYETLIGKGTIIDEKDIETHIKKTYERKLNDEYVEPALIGPEARPIKDNDSLIFFDFREDRMKQIISPFILPEFDKFPRENFKNLLVATMTRYDEAYKVPVAFLPERSDNPIGKIISESGKSQFRIAESQKYPHVTYFFNGLREEPFPNEYRVLIPSKSVIRQDEHPEMMAADITTRLVEAIEEGVFDFILANYENPDMVAHTGNFQASVQAVKITDEQIGRVLKAAVSRNAFLIITSDHGNAERVFDPQTGKIETKHDASPVPIYLVAEEFKKTKTESDIIASEKSTIGILADIAPTILELMELPKPQEMTGQSLLRFFS
ncbi:MAG: 2,3-bisphosphoglycerate-independent phosphoglycerate mutase [Candidatus Wolfebacteria bacterium]|nr:2,3-bisphosphoglycerate-independent phosphoglycerate mutase [Candidatus Wolfebacteria bacterium]